jgi:hypothetical protein
MFGNLIPDQKNKEIKKLASALKSTINEIDWAQFIIDVNDQEI